MTDEQPIMWGMHEALNLIREIQPTVHKMQYHVALAGGVLNKGFSRKDLDLVFIPLTNENRPELAELTGWLFNTFGEPKDNLTDPNPCVSLRYQASYMFGVNEIRSTPDVNYREIVQRRIDVFVV